MGVSSKGILNYLSTLHSSEETLVVRALYQLAFAALLRYTEYSSLIWNQLEFIPSIGKVERIRLTLPTEKTIMVRSVNWMDLPNLIL